MALRLVQQCSYGLEVATGVAEGRCLAQHEGVGRCGAGTHNYLALLGHAVPLPGSQAPSWFQRDLGNTAVLLTQTARFSVTSGLVDSKVSILP